MKKIIEQALTSAGFKNADAITEVIFATPNPNVAAEMILGCYSSDRVYTTWYRKGDTLYRLKSIDELRDLVSYERTIQKTKSVYYASKEDKENGVYYEEYRRDYYTSGSIPVPGCQSYNEEMNIEQWDRNGAKEISESEYINTILQWNYSPEEVIAG